MEQHWSKTEAKRVQETFRLLEQWKSAVEERTKENFPQPKWKHLWTRTFNPQKTKRRLTWQRNIDRLIVQIEIDWNSKNTERNDKPLKLTAVTFQNGPRGDLMEAGESADLQELPKPTAREFGHLSAYLNHLRSRVDQAQVGQNIIAERTLREAMATTMEALRTWDSAASELECIVKINLHLQEYAYATRTLLREGIALYNAKEYGQAEDTLNRAILILETNLPQNSELRTQIRIYDYLGLCHIKLRKPKKALDIFLDKSHRARTAKMPTPLGDASRKVRIGIAYLDLGDHKKAKPFFVDAARLRLEIGAVTESARALRYLGLLYFRDGNLIQAASVWDLALHIQRGFRDENEQVKLHFFRGRLFASLEKDCKINPNGNYSSGINCTISELLFPDHTERELLLKIEQRFRDSARVYPRNRYLNMAYFCYKQCVELANNDGLKKWVHDADLALKNLPKSH